MKVSFPFLPMLALVFITLKLTDHIDWSWWWVLAPLWLPFIILVICVAVYVAADVKVNKR